MLKHSENRAFRTFRSNWRLKKKHSSDMIQLFENAGDSYFFGSRGMQWADEFEGMMITHSVL